MEKTYLCDRWPQFVLQHIRFQDGKYVTKDPQEQAFIEASKHFGVHIHAIGEEQEAESRTFPRRGPGRPPGGVRQGSRGTLSYHPKEDDDDGNDH